MTHGLIYAATCTVTGSSYVGQTTQTLYTRRQQHEYQAFARRSDGCQKFYRALRKHGAAAFEWRVLSAEVPVENLNATEARFIAEMDSAARGYNICREGVTTRGLTLSRKTRRRMSKAKRPPKSAEHRRKLGDARRGVKLPPWWCKRIGDSKRGIKQTAETIAKRVAKLRGLKQSPEVIAKRVATRKANGRKQPPWTEERRAYMSAIFKGRVFTEEWKRKISEAKKGRRSKMETSS